MAMSYKGAISFGLIYIPIAMHNVIKSNNINFNLIEKNTQSRVKYKKTCVDCNNEEVKPEDIVKGYEYEEGKYVIFDNDDFERLKTKKDRDITIQHFVNLNEIDPIYYNKAYYVVPEKGAIKAFELLKLALEKQKKVGIAKTVLGTKETLIALRVKDKIMYLNTMHFYEEIQDLPLVDKEIKVDKQELFLAITLINTMSKKFEPNNYIDEYRQKIEAAIESKILGKEIVITKEAPSTQVIDLMSALQASIDKTKSQPRV